MVAAWLTMAVVATAPAHPDPAYPDLSDGGTEEPSSSPEPLVSLPHEATHLTMEPGPGWSHPGPLGARLYVGDPVAAGRGRLVVEAYPLALHAAPEAHPGRRGMVLIRSGADGRVLSRLEAPADVIFAAGLSYEVGGLVGVRAVVDVDGDGRPVTALMWLDPASGWLSAPAMPEEAAGHRWVLAPDVAAVLGLGPLPGDVNDDGMVDMADLAEAAASAAPEALASLRAVLAHFGATRPEGLRAPGSHAQGRGIPPGGQCPDCWYIPHFPGRPGGGGGGSGDRPDDGNVGPANPGGQGGGGGGGEIDPPCADPLDRDCDGVPDAVDCDSVFYTGSPCDCDMDGDGVVWGEEDDDCDGVPNAQDCDHVCALEAGEACCEDSDGDGLIDQWDPDSACYVTPRVDLRVDANHSGELDADDAALEDVSPGRVVVVNDDMHDPETSDDELVAVSVTAPPAADWVVGRGERVALWLDRERLLPLEAGVVHAGPAPSTIWVEGLEAGALVGDQWVSLTALEEGCPPASDSVTLTVLELGMEAPEAFQVDAGELYPAAVWSLGIAEEAYDETSLEALIEASEGLPLTFALVHLVDGPGAPGEPVGPEQVVAEETVETEVSAAAAALLPPTAAGRTYVVDLDFLGAKRRSTVFESLPGEADEAVWEVASAPVADGRTPLNGAVLLLDRYGHLVPDGTEVSFEVTGGAAEFVEEATSPAIEGVAAFFSVTLPKSSPRDPLVVEVTCGHFSAEVAVTISSAVGQLVTSARRLDIAMEESATVTLQGVNVPDGTEVHWTCSQGRFGPGAGHLTTSIVQGGRTSRTVQATDDGGSRIGDCIVTAKVGDSMMRTTIAFHDSRAFTVEVDAPVICGDVTADGQRVVSHAGDPIPNNPAGATPPDRVVSYKAAATLTLTGRPGDFCHVTLDDPRDAFLVTLVGVDDDGLVELDEFGVATVLVQSRGTFAPGRDPEAIELTITSGPEPLLVWLLEQLQWAGLPISQQWIDGIAAASVEQRHVRVTMTDSRFWAETVDAVQAFFGGDAEDLDEIAANVAGGIVGVGDAGSIIKNMWRYLGFSDKEPNWLEVTLSGISFLLEFAPVIGDALDAGISFIRAVATVVGDTTMLRVLVDGVREVLRTGDIQAARKLGDFLAPMMRGDIAIKNLDEVLASRQLVKSATKVTEGLGPELGEVWLKQLDQLSVTSFPPGTLSGTARARQVATVCAQLNPSAAAWMKTLTPTQLASFTRNMARATGEVASSTRLRKVLDNDAAFSQNYTRLHLMDDIARVADQSEDLAGLRKLVNGMSNPIQNFARGRIYELVAARTFIDQGYEVTHFSRFVPRSIPLTSTDIDLILKGPGGEIIFVQVKTTVQAMDRWNMAAWITKITRYTKNSPDLPSTPTIKMVTSNQVQSPLTVVRAQRLGASLFPDIPLPW